MNRIILRMLIVFFTAQLYGQTEFKSFNNGLIYNEKTMNKLRHIVDSLNLKYKTCNFNTNFNSKSQTIGHLIIVDKDNIKEAKKDMENQISLDDFIKKYPNATVEQNILIIKSKYRNRKKQDVIEFEEFDIVNEYGLSIISDDVSLDKKDFANKWLVKYSEKTSYADESLAAFYFPTNFSSVSIPKKYAQMIGYSDCLIDTTTAKFKDNLKEGWVELPKKWQYLSVQKKEALLDEMRSTRVIGFCSQDNRPIVQAINIAMLSAEVANWNVFLKSHLDIMNDRFDRISDGSYAYAERKTYIKELEELDINVNDLLIGISLRIENPAKNHYYGSIHRLGRAISESKNKEEFENQILSMVEDKELDNFNRVVAYLLFVNYNDYIEDKGEQKENKKKLEISITTLPDFLKSKIKV